MTSEESRILSALAGEVGELAERVTQLSKRIAKLEVQSQDLVVDRVESLRMGMNHMWKEIERITGHALTRPEKPVGERSPKGGLMAGIEGIASEAKREAARKDGERAVR